MDLKMPGLDGSEATRRLRRREAESGSPRTPIVALTANVLEDERSSGKSAGFDAFLAKPLDQGDLASEIERLCGLRAEAAAPVPRAS